MQRTKRNGRDGILVTQQPVFSRQIGDGRDGVLGSSTHDFSDTQMKKEKVPKEQPKVPHPVDDLIKAEPKMDQKLQQLDPRKLGKLRRIARLEREFSGQEEW